jgi:L-glutamine:scyllo-inosose aminotransferase/L-glutamine:2-deoxy-scyllo-inosose/3-amino-2,3-dideoxy-scyllo-inosose aminotransferase
VRTRVWPKWPRADRGTERILIDVLHSGRWALSGAYAGETCFERRAAATFAAYHEVPYCTPTTSGTAALTLALLALEVGPGDEVLVPGLTWVACASAVLAIGAVPVLVDVDYDSLAMSCAAAREAITARTRAIMIVHPFCTLAAIDDFVELSRATGIPLVEDCSQAHGAAWNGQRVGTFGDIGCFSMQQSKVLTCGEGGAVITRDRLLSDRMEQLRCDGRMFASEGARLGRLELVEVGGVQGRNLCLSEFQAALLLDQMQHLDAENAYRSHRAAQLDRLLTSAAAGVSMLAAPAHVTARVFYNIALRIDLGRFADIDVDTIARALSEELNTPVNPIYRPMNRHPLYQPLKAPRGGLSDQEWERRNAANYPTPQAERARATYLTLTHPVLLDDEASVEDIALGIVKVQERAAELRELPTDLAVARQAF